MTPDETATTSVRLPGQREPEPTAPRPHGSSMWRLVELEATTSRDFDDPKLEWRRLFSELLGTFLLVLVGAGGAVVNAQSDGAISRTAAVTALAMMVMSIILFMGTVSGANPNPAVPLGF